MTIGIYEIKNLVNEKVYVGSSINIEQRLGQHKSMLRNNKHHSSHLQSAWNKYGEDNFEMKVILEVENPEFLLEAEQKEIYARQSHISEFGYNVREIVSRACAAALGFFPPKQEKKVKVDTNTTITFRAREEDRIYLRTLAAQANCSQAELILKLLYNYGETQVAVMREEQRFTPESGLPEDADYLKFCRELSELVVSMPEYTDAGTSYIAAEKWCIAHGGVDFGKLYHRFNGDPLQAFEYIRD